MTAMETLLANPFEEAFTGFVCNDDIKKIKSHLFEQYHITLPSSLKDFQKFESITEQVLGNDSVPTIKKTFDHICHLESGNIMEIKDESLKNSILSSFENPTKKEILDIAFDYPLTVWEIASRVKFGSFSIPENISYLISHGLLATNDSESEPNKKYYSTIDEFSIRIEDKEFHMYVTINEIANENPLKTIS